MYSRKKNHVTSYFFCRMMLRKNLFHTIFRKIVRKKFLRKGQIMWDNKEFNDNKQKQYHPQPLFGNDRIEQSQPFYQITIIGDPKFQLTVIKEILNKINYSFVTNSVKINTLLPHIMFTTTIRVRKANSFVPCTSLDTRYIVGLI